MKYVFGNWKMYLNVENSIALAKQLANFKFDISKVAVSVFPNQLVAREVREVLSENISCGAQNVSAVPMGAYTGATSAELFKEIAFGYALIGHSERRHIFGESNEVIRKKIESCIDSGIIPVLCIGETKEERDNGIKEDVLKEQLSKALENLKNAGEVIIAYEPVWAIGTGDACDPKDAEETHKFIKQECLKYTQSELPVFYGGSVEAENMLSYLTSDTVDGVLVGSASTKFDSFSQMIKEAETI